MWAVAGGKGGVGKSLLAVNLAMALTRQGLRVLLVDGDLGGANLHAMIGMSGTGRTLGQLLQGQWPDLSTIMQPTRFEGLELVVGSAGVLGVADQPREKLLDLASLLRRSEADVVLLDLGSGASYGTLDLFLAADVQMVVSTPEPTSIQNVHGFVKCALGRAHDVGASEHFAPQLVVNRADAGTARCCHRAIAALTERFLGRSLPLLGHLRHDALAESSVLQQVPAMVLDPGCAFSRDLQAVSGRLLSSQERLSLPTPENDQTFADFHRIQQQVQVGLKSFHVRTEDLGEAMRQVRTQVFHGGQVVFTKLTPYLCSLPIGIAAAGDGQLQEQHDGVVHSISKGRIG